MLTAGERAQGGLSSSSGAAFPSPTAHWGVSLDPLTVGVLGVVLGAVLTVTRVLHALATVCVTVLDTMQSSLVELIGRVTMIAADMTNVTEAVVTIFRSSVD